MLDSTDLVRGIKKAAREMLEAAKPSDLFFGTVVSNTPLQIQVEQKLLLSSAQIVLTRNVVDFETKVQISWETKDTGGGTGDQAFESHRHVVSGTKTIRVLNGLQVGEEVVLCRTWGGQKFIVLDRIGKG